MDLECGFHGLLRGSNEPREDYYARLRGVIRRADQQPKPFTPRRARPPVDRSPLFAALSQDRWTTSREIASVIGMAREAALAAIKRAISRGAAIESHPKRGYRLIATAGEGGVR
jgi:biotin operon repressor